MVKFLKQEAKTKKKDQACRIILVEKTDRLYRNFKDYVILDVDELDLEVHLVTENEILTKDADSYKKLIHGLRVLMAKQYIDNLKEEVTKGQHEKAEQGIYPSYAPVGYMNVKCGDKHFIQPDPVRSPLVIKLFEWYVTGQYSLLELARKAHEEGLEYRKTGNKIYKSAIHKMLQNPIYYGDFIWITIRGTIRTFNCNSFQIFRTENCTYSSSPCISKSIRSCTSNLYLIFSCRSNR